MYAPSHCNKANFYCYSSLLKVKYTKRLLISVFLTISHTFWKNDYIKIKFIYDPEVYCSMTIDKKKNHNLKGFSVFINILLTTEILFV